MSEQPRSKATPVPRFSLDTWAVLVALFAAALIRFGTIPRISW